MIRPRRGPDAATALRTIEIGDFWVYDVSGDLRPPGSGTPHALSGTIAVCVGPDTLVAGSGGVTLSFVQDVQAEDADGNCNPLPAPELRFSFVQDETTGDASIIADNMGPGGMGRRAAAPQVFYPGRWCLGTRYDNRLQFGDQDFVHNTLLVTGQVTVDTPAGAFPAWVAEITSESAAMGRVTGIDWWTPELGAPACFETCATLPDGATIRMLALLSRTNVLHAQSLVAERQRW